ncbi:hypothetical protein B566_EDAN009950 [Ephemera danica]|nr:hypothetical protein B566_EDAN009950 [Ephemera danica]
MVVDTETKRTSAATSVPHAAAKMSQQTRKEITPGAKARRELQRGRQAVHSQSGQGLIKTVGAADSPDKPVVIETKSIIKASKSNSSLENNKTMSPKSSSTMSLTAEKIKPPLNATKSSPALEMKPKQVVTRSSTVPVPKVTPKSVPPVVPVNKSRARATRRPSKVSLLPAVPFIEVYEQCVFSKPFRGALFLDLEQMIANNAEHDEARSEEQLASERAWLEAERVWVTHRTGFSLARRLAPASPHAGGENASEAGDKVRVRLEPSAIEANAPQFDRAEDVCQLRFLNESSALHTMRQRYASNLVHTYAGPALLVLNPAAPLAAYSDKLAFMFRGCAAEDMPPHVYSAAQAAYRALLSSRRDQALVFAGRSGAGKSTNLRHAMHYLVMAAGSSVLTVERLGALGVVLESFGCARTSHNTSATRMTTLYSLDVDQAGQIASANIQVLLAEKSRVSAHADSELAFHVLYRLLAGAEGAARRELGLDPLTALPNLLITPLAKSN